jgi:hypothetical protein
VLGSESQQPLDELGIFLDGHAVLEDENLAADVAALEELVGEDQALGWCHGCAQFTLRAWTACR